MTERGSTHHSPRVDDELAHETESLTHGAPLESRVDEWRLKEAPADGEPLPDAQVTHTDAPLRGSLSTNEVEQRSLLAISLRPGAFPATAHELREIAEKEHGDAVVLEWLMRLPDDRSFANVQEVWDALGGHHEQRTTPAAASAEPEASASALDRILDRPVRLARQAGELAGRVAGVGLAVGAAGRERLSRVRRGSDPSGR
jgi:Protein of unknown function (DUF2795)